MDRNKSDGDSGFFCANESFDDQFPSLTCPSSSSLTTPTSSSSSDEATSTRFSFEATDIIAKSLPNTFIRNYEELLTPDSNEHDTSKRLFNRMRMNPVVHYSTLSSSAPEFVPQNINWPVSPIRGFTTHTNWRTSTPTKSRRSCGYCKRSGYDSSMFDSHLLRNPVTEEIMCPILSEQMCEICGDTGDNSSVHATDKCPNKTGLQPFLINLGTNSNTQ